MEIYLDREFHESLRPTYEVYAAYSRGKNVEDTILLNAAKDCISRLFNFRKLVASFLAPRQFERFDVAQNCPDYNLLADAETFFLKEAASINQSIHGQENSTIDINSTVEVTIVDTMYPFVGEEVYPRKFFSVLTKWVMFYPLKETDKPRDLLEITTNVINFWGTFIKESLVQNLQFNGYRYEGNDTVVRTKDYQQKEEDKLNVHPRSDGNMQLVMIARRWEPRISDYQEVGFDADGGVQTLPISVTGSKIRKMYGFWPLAMAQNIPNNTLQNLQNLATKAKAENYSSQQFIEELEKIDPTKEFFQKWIIPKDQTNLLAMLALLISALTFALNLGETKQNVINNYTTIHVNSPEQKKINKQKINAQAKKEIRKKKNRNKGNRG